LLALQAKIVCLLLLVPHSPLYAMQLVNPLSSTDDKEIFESALQLLSDFQVFAIQFQSVHR
jgi:hypothetical protein